jgi:hypothetical protein
MEEAALDIFLPVLESAVVLASHYARACGRVVVLSEDMKLGMMFAARNVTGRQVGSLYPEIYEESDSGSDLETDEETDPEWVRYEGDDDMAIKMNECYDTWDAWEPDGPAERALKAAVNKANIN